MKSDNIKVSVVVPVYNVEQLLPRCLDSLLNQTLGEIEVLCVNDCSPDGSGAILDSYASRDSRVRPMHKDANEGPMMARRTGYDNARGEYIFFCDSDDYLPADALRRLYEAAQESGADITAGDLCLVNTEGRKVPKHRAEKMGHTADSYLHSILHWNTPSLCGALFHRRLFDGHTYTALRHQPLSEDRMLLTEILVLRHPTIQAVDGVTYYYWQNNSSTTRSRLDERTARIQFAALFRCYDFLEAHTDRFTADNDNFILRYLSLYIERGCHPAMVREFNDHTRRLLRYSEMRRVVGTRLATHTALCMHMPGYRNVMHGIRLLIRRVQGKD